MSCDKNLAYAGSMENLKYLDKDEFRLHNSYNIKDPLDESNQLPITQSKEKIVQAINSNRIVLISGVMGCGKSTQIPQYIFDDCMSRKEHCNLIVTQPRRIAAITVSKQVNKERGWKDGQLVGYQVGLDKNYDSVTTKMLFCTTGILLKKIIKKKSLSKYTHIILDEVHERTLEMDFLFLIIKKLMKTNSQSVRVILMSATANPYKLYNYFNTNYSLPDKIHEEVQLINIDGTTNYSITKYYLDDLHDCIHHVSQMDFSKPLINKAGYLTAIQLVKDFDRIETEKCIKKNSSVLIFLPGIFEIENMYKLMTNEMTSENFKWILMPLHSSTPIEEQNRINETPPLHHRKIILATNIAESSITIPDIYYVIDFCLMKKFQKDSRSNFSMLVMAWTSKSNCEQRAGRVGRVSEGRVYRLVPKTMFNEKFQEHKEPEMNHCPLHRVVLMSKLFDMGSPKELLNKALDPPSSKNIVYTTLTLKQMGALLPTVNGQISSEDGDITLLGKVMAQLPLDPCLSKLIYFGHIFNILNEAIVMGCGMSIRNIFSQPFQDRLTAYVHKLSWANYSYSDPMAYINSYQSWLEKKPEFDLDKNLEISWTQNNFIESSAMRELYDLIKDVTDKLKIFNIIVNLSEMNWNQSEEKAMACKVILAGSFYPNYFIGRKSNENMDEQHALHLLDGHDPYRTVYLSGFTNKQPKEMNKKAIENMFPENIVGKPTAYFDNSNKVYVEFPTSLDKIVPSNQQESQLIPGNVSFGVFVALKMNQLNHKFALTLTKKRSALSNSSKQYNLKGPFSPLEMSLHGINQNASDKIAKIERQSVNSILLDTCPYDYYGRLIVAGNIFMNEKNRLTLWDTTIMPNIPGMPAMMCLLFSPCVEIRYNFSFTKMIGAVCGLGYNPSTTTPWFMENDIEIKFDTNFDNDFLIKVNKIRMLLNKCVNPADGKGLVDILEVTHDLQNSLLELFNVPTKLKSVDIFPLKYEWACIPTPRLQSPHPENSEMSHPMNGSDVYKLIWTAKLSSKLSQIECEEICYKLSNINILKDETCYNNIVHRPHEELYCPLCDQNFASIVSMRMHFNNHQHIERYELSKNELLDSFTGPFSMIKNL